MLKKFLITTVLICIIPAVFRMTIPYTGNGVQSLETFRIETSDHKEETPPLHHQTVSFQPVSTHPYDLKQAEDNTNDATGSQKESTDIDINTLDRDALKHICNKRYSWWIRLNKKNEPTTINKNAKEILKKYNGVYIGNTDEKTIYLTFDEGYENGYTPMILDTLKENDVKAVFFITHPYIAKNSDLVKRMIEEGHEVGNHTVNHHSLPSLKISTLEKEFLSLEESFTKLTGKSMKYMRPPKGEYSERVLEAARQLGYKTVFWSYAYKDYDVKNQKGADHAYKMVMDNLHNGAVILLHAVSKDNAEALDRIIKSIKASGYDIKPFDL